MKRLIDTETRVGTMRGIINQTGTACHLNAALIVLSTLGLSNKEEEEADPTLAEFLQRLRSTDDSAQEPIDSSTLNDRLRRKLHLEANDLGDAVTALSRLLSLYGAGGSHSLFAGGRVTSTLRGRRGSEERIKRLKEKKLSNPLSLMVDERHESLVDLLRSYTAERTVNYKWDGQTDWSSTRSLAINSFPDIFMVHLQRFKMQSSGKLVAPERTIEIPQRIDLNEFSQEQGAGLYELRSGIVHVDDLEDDEESEEHGHYIAIVRQNNNTWCLVDDEIVKAIDDASLYFGGFSDSNHFFRGVLLTYHRLEATPNT